MTTKQFERLSRANKAIAVMQDVLIQLKINRYNANKGAYIDQLDVNYQLYDKQVNEHFEEICKCNVCFIGATLLSSTHLGNKLTLCRNIIKNNGKLIL